MDHIAPNQQINPATFVNTMNESSIKRFWDKVDVRGPDECWPWIAGTNNKGYGVFSRVDWRQGMMLAHRFSYFLATETMPNVCRHTCDNPLCVNPAHLLDGTQKDNMKDCARRGRLVNHNTAKTHCVEGHPYNYANTHVRSHRPSAVTGIRGLRRSCVTCQREYNRQHTARRKAELRPAI